MKIIVNAIPLVNVNTGISRYLKCLYTAIEKMYGDQLEIEYFNGKDVSRQMPHGPKNLAKWSRIVNLFWKLPSYPALALRLLVHYKREFRFLRLAKAHDIYHEAAFFPYKTPKRTKTIFTIHDLSLQRFPEHHPRERVLYTNLFFNRRLKDVKHYLTVSAFTALEVKKYLNITESSITVTPLSHNPDIFYPQSEDTINSCLNKYSLPQKYFLFVGSGDPRKNAPIIPEAIKKANINIPLVSVGWSGWATDNKSTGVIFLGYVDDTDLASIYSGAIALILPSSYEGFGLPVLEAMASGCPVITTKNAGLPEVAQDASLYLKYPLEINDLADILVKVANDHELCKEYSGKGLKQAMNFSWEQTAELTFDTFKKALKS